MEVPSGEPGNGSNVRITLTHVYEAVQSLRDEVRENASEFKAHQQLPIHPGARETVTDHEARIRVLEATGGRIASEALAASRKVEEEREKDLRNLEEEFLAIRKEIQGQCALLQKDHNKLANKVNWAFGAVAAALVFSDIVLRTILK